jgi:HD-like signal output (HDOD) protein
MKTRFGVMQRLCKFTTDTAKLLLKYSCRDCFGENHQMFQVVVIGVNPTLQSLVRHLCAEHSQLWHCRFFPTVGSYLQAPRLDSQIDLLIFDGLNTTASLEDKRLVCFQAPLALRVIVTTPEHDDVVLGHLSHFHSFVGSELNTEHLELLFSNAARLSELPIGEQERRLVGGLIDFPQLPALLSGLDKLLAEPNVSSAAVAGLVSTDPLVVSRLFQLINSPYMGFVSETWNLEVAISRLGYQSLRSLVLLLAMKGGNVQAEQQAEYQRVLDQILAQAGQARSYARSSGFNRVLQDQVFIAALLSGFGKLVLLQNGREAGDAELTEVNPAGRGSYLAVSAFLLTLWGFENWVVAAVLNQHSWQTAGIGAQISNCLFLARAHQQGAVKLNASERQQALQAGFVL